MNITGAVFGALLVVWCRSGALSRGRPRDLFGFGGSGVGRRKALGLVRLSEVGIREDCRTHSVLRRGWMAGWRTGWGIAPSAHPGSSPNLLVGARESHWECVVLLAIGIKK